MRVLRCIFSIVTFATAVSAASFAGESPVLPTGKAADVAAQAARPIDAAFDKLAEYMTGWTLVERDEAQSVILSGSRGYRIVFSRRVGMHRMVRADGRYVLLGSIPDKPLSPTWADFVLFEDDDAAPENAAAIPWPEREPADTPRDMFLGRGMGFVWFARAPVLNETSVIKALGLAGADMTALLASALTSADPETAWRCAAHLVHLEKEDSLPEIEKALAERRALGLHDGPLIMMLAGIHNERADALIREAYQGDCRDFAEYVLSCQPYRPALKDLYRDMLESKREVSACSRAAVEFGWADFKPLLEKTVADSLWGRNYEAAFAALRALEGTPIPESAIEARNNILERKDSYSWQVNESAAAVITSMEDKQAAAMLTVSLITCIGEKGTQQRASHLVEGAKTLVSRLPQEVTLPMLEAIVEKYSAREDVYRDGSKPGAVAQLRLAAMGIDGPLEVIRPMTPEESREVMGTPGVKTRAESYRIWGRALSQESPGPLVTGVDAVALFTSLAPDYRELREPYYRRSVGGAGVRYVMVKGGADPDAREGRASFTVGVFENREKAVAALGRDVSLTAQPGRGLVGLGERAYCARSAQGDYANIRFRRKNVVVHLGLPLPEDEAIAFAGKMDSMLEHDIMFVRRGEKVAVPRAMLKGFPNGTKHGESVRGQLEITDANAEEIIVNGAVGLGVPDRTLVSTQGYKVSGVTFVALGEGTGKIEVFIANLRNNVTTAVEKQIAIEP